MKLVNFSVTNYRSITKAHKISLQSLTVLVGKNNEGKSNLLTALNVAMTVLMRHGRVRDTTSFWEWHNRNLHKQYLYEWDRDFPVQLRNRTSKNGLESIFKLEFRLENEELLEFHKEMKIRGNEDIPIVIKIGRENDAKIEVPKKGSSSYNKKSEKIANFISHRISFNYIQAVRTENMALSVLRDVIYDELNSLTQNEEYNKNVKRINELQQEILDRISSQLIEPLRVFLPQLQNVQISKQSDDYLSRNIRDNIEVIIDDGTPTSISYKGDGIKSLVTLAILKDKRVSMPASIIAIEEPESHLHSGAIHSLVEVINNISQNNQVIITTHNPLFVQQNNIKSNIIVNQGTAQPAKNIAEIRNVLGVLPSDNLKNASHVFIVEGEDDKIALTKILSAMSKKLSTALSSNKLVIKVLGGAGNLSHDIADLKNCMCNYFVLLDNDQAGNDAVKKALSKGLLTEADYKLTICNGSPCSEFEDCLKKEIYEETLLENFQTNINDPLFRNNKKWSDRVKDIRLSQGGPWTESIEKKIKFAVADAIPETILNLDDVIIMQKSGFLNGCVEALERMLEIN